LAFTQHGELYAIQCEFCDEELLDEDGQVILLSTTKGIYKVSRADGWKGVLCGDRRIRQACDSCLVELKATD
jgi:hypothetical protein